MSKVSTDFLHNWFIYGLIFAILRENKAVAIIREELVWNDSS